MSMTKHVKEGNDESKMDSWNGSVFGLCLGLNIPLVYGHRGNSP